MGLFNFFKKSSNQHEEELRNERKLQVKATKLSKSELEAFAKEIVRAFSNYNGNDMDSFDKAEEIIRPIGEAINDYDTQLLVLDRAIALGEQKGVEVHTREMEHFWDGIGGWMK